MGQNGDVDAPLGLEEFVRRYIGALRPKWVHVQRVAASAAVGGRSFAEPSESAVLVRAAWLHDIGYADRLALTGFTRWRV